MLSEKVHNDILMAFDAQFSDFRLNRNAIVSVYNALVMGELVQRAMPRVFESWTDVKGRKLVALTQDQVDALLEIRDEFGKIMTSQGKNLHGIDNSWRISYKASVSKEECVACGESYNIKDMTYMPVTGLIEEGYYCPPCYDKRWDNA